MYFFLFQKAELLIPERLTSFVFTSYAEFLIHMYKAKLFDPDECSQRVIDEIEAYMVGGLRRCQVDLTLLVFTRNAASYNQTLDIVSKYMMNIVVIFTITNLGVTK